MDRGAYEALIINLKRTDPDAVADGATVVELYDASSPRLLWILREPDGGGGWDMRTYLATDEALFSYTRACATFSPVARISHGILDGCCPWGVWGTDWKKCTPALRRVAVINISKRGGDASVRWSRLYRAAREYAPVLKVQIEMLAPQVVILAGTFELLPDDTRAALGDIPLFTAKRVDDCVWFRGYHPNQRKVSVPAYYEMVRAELIRLAR